MIPVDQTILKPPLGNCYAACIASIFEVSIDEVPSPIGDEGLTRWSDYEARLQDQFFASRGIYTVLSTVAKDWTPPGYTILSAISPRGDYEHAVVCLDGIIVHDPHPRRDMGVGEWKTWILFCTMDPIK
jgi:hypothetical protein